MEKMIQEINPNITIISNYSKRSRYEKLFLFYAGNRVGFNKEELDCAEKHETKFIKEVQVSPHKKIRFYLE